jgi:hypothetical protein
VQNRKVRVYVFKVGAYEQLEVGAVAGVQVSAMAMDGKRVVGGIGGGAGVGDAALVVAAGW